MSKEKYGITDAHYLCDSAIFNTETNEILRLYQVCEMLNQQYAKIADLEAKLAESEEEKEVLRISQSSSHKALMQLNDELLKTKQQLEEKERDIKWLTEEYNKERHRANEIANTAMKHNYDMAIQQLQRVKEEMHRGLEFDYDLDIWATEFIDAIINEIKGE